VIELTTETCPDVLRENPFIPTTPLLPGSRGLTVELGGVVLSGPVPEALPAGYKVA